MTYARHFLSDSVAPARNLTSLAAALVLGHAACTPSAVSYSCEVDADCAGGEVCQEGVCLPDADAGRADAGRSDTGRSDTAGPDPDALSWDDAALGGDAAAVVDAAAADGAADAAAWIDASVPDAARPDAARPDAALPDTAPVDDFCLGGDVVLRERLSSSSSGQVSGGSFTGEGWRTSGTGDQISWNLGETVSSGSIEFEARGFHADVGGCFWGVCYYVGLFEEANGDKLADYTGSAFIESRFHNNQQENFHDTIKLQAGDGDGSMQEPMIPPGLGWSASEWHRFRIEWGGGQSRLYLDGAQRLSANYGTGRAIDWRYLFLGTTNYKGVGWAATGVTYRDLCVRR